MKKKILVTVLCLSMAMAVFTGCGKTEETTGSVADTQQTEQVVAEENVSETEEIVETTESTEKPDISNLGEDQGCIITDDITVANEDVVEYLKNRPDEERQADLEDGWLGVDVSIDPATGQSIATSIIDGKTVYHIGDRMPTGNIFSGDSKNNFNDYLENYRQDNPDDTDVTDAEIEEMWHIGFGK